MKKYEVVKKGKENNVKPSSLNGACVDAICGNGFCRPQNYVCCVPVVLCHELETCKCPEECPTLQLC